MLPLMLALSLGAPLDEKPKDDQKALQGAWVVVAAELDGKEFKEALKAVMTLKDDKLTVKLANGQTTEGTFKFDASAKPKTIDLIPNDDKKPKALCIYQLDGDKLKLCMIDKPGVDRPTEFKSGPNTYLLEFKREKP
jgi:uncharacterized protein (TIGR03067 family)